MSTLTSSSAHSLQFSPSPNDFQQILHDLCDPELSLVQVAERHQAPLPALVAWLAQPDIAQQLDRYESACARRTSLIVASFLPTLVESVRSIVADLQAEAQIAAPPAARRSARSMTLNAIRILLRFANLGAAKPRSSARTRADLSPTPPG